MTDLPVARTTPITENDAARSHLLCAVRETEAALAARYLPPGGRLLEVGAGHGYQARFFDGIGFQVNAIDVKDSPHIASALFPIQVNDGLHIPFPSETFDIVFSSNVLEHVALCENLLVEMSRVLKRNGVMVHVVPTTCWRMWTTLAHYVVALRSLLGLARSNARSQPRRPGQPSEQGQGRSFSRLVRAGLLPSRHGVRGNWLTEVYHFSGVRWRRSFRVAGLQIQAAVNAGLFYTGYGIPGPQVPMATRAKLAHWLGSSSVVYVLRKPSAQQSPAGPTLEREKVDSSRNALET